MSVTRRDFNTREEWLANRTQGIGGSEIASVIGQNPWCNNVELWEYKTGRRTRPDISDEEAVRYGIRAEHLIRELYELDYPNNTVYYTEFNSWQNDRYPWALASLDGWILDDSGRLGVLEIKTSEVRNAQDWNKWTESIPQNYFCNIITENCRQLQPLLKMECCSLLEYHSTSSGSLNEKLSKKGSLK